MIRLLLNILWFIFGGFISGCLWLLGGALLAITCRGPALCGRGLAHRRLRLLAVRQGNRAPASW
jgi:uncharacterized membrane protein YccF (DUF307 family)